MNKLVQERIDDLLHIIEKVKKTSDDADLVQWLMPDANIWLDHEVNVSWAVKSIEEVKTVLRDFAELGIMLARFVQSEQNPQWQLNGINTKILLTPSWSTNAENTCRLVQTGVSTYPTYKLVCEGKENINDAAQDGQQQESAVQEV
jgi:hypothetical protein